ncbi:MAG TPA: methyltransferase domain-containing protein [Rhizomicrobium sp.]|jgi:ubiquinone/menaquinone biosynthesis C-methylase UbiE
MDEDGGKDAAPWSRVTGKGVYPVEHAWMLLLPLRRLICPPAMLIRRMRLARTDRVLEIGCGPGYFSPAVARRVSHLTLFDYQDGMLDIAEKRLKRRGLENHARQRGDAKALPFADGTFDTAFMVTVLGEVGDAGAALREAGRVLKPGGRLSITEVKGDPDFVPLDTLTALAAASGLSLEQRFGPRFYYTANFRKPE